VTLAHQRSSGLGPARAARRGERGETLPEVLVTVVLLGIGFTGILGALLTSTTIARQNAERTRATAAAQIFGEAAVAPVVDFDGPEGPNPGIDNYIDCAVPASYTRTLPTDPTGAAPGQRPFEGYSVEVVSVQFLNWGPAATFPTGFDSFGVPQWLNPGDACVFTQNSDGGLQRLRIEVKRNGQTVDSLVVVKRDPGCPDTFNNADLGPC
jgi:prepilin-type N-terminal cleavage/methylation domain-containing protein